MEAIPNTELIDCRRLKPSARGAKRNAIQTASTIVAALLHLSPCRCFVRYACRHYAALHIVYSPADFGDREGVPCHASASAQRTNLTTILDFLTGCVGP